MFVGDNDMSDEARGHMDISAQRQMWRSFVKLTNITVVGLIILLVLMAIFLL